MKQRWFSGRMLACHAGGPGSILGRCSSFFCCVFEWDKNENKLIWKGMDEWNILSGEYANWK
jgi:hypothetical protein